MDVTIDANSKEPEPVPTIKYNINSILVKI